MTLDAAYEIFAVDIRAQCQEQPILLGNLSLDMITGTLIRSCWEYFYSCFRAYEQTCQQTGDGEFAPQPMLSLRQVAACKHKEALFTQLESVFNGVPTITPLVMHNIG